MHNNGIHTDAEIHLCKVEDAWTQYQSVISLLLPDVKAGNITVDQATALAQPDFDEWFDLRTGADWSS